MNRNPISSPLSAQLPPCLRHCSQNLLPALSPLTIPPSQKYQERERKRETAGNSPLCTQSETVTADCADRAISSVLRARFIYGKNVGQTRLLSAGAEQDCMGGSRAVPEPDSYGLRSLRFGMVSRLYERGRGEAVHTHNTMQMENIIQPYDLYYEYALLDNIGKPTGLFIAYSYYSLLLLLLLLRL